MSKRAYTASGTDIVNAYRLMNRGVFTKVKPSQQLKALKICNALYFDLLLERSELEMEKGLGVIAIRKFKAKKPVVDYKRTKLKGSLAINHNDHTNGYVYAVKWIKKPTEETTMNLCDRSIWKFRASRTLTRGVLMPLLLTGQTDHPIQ